MTDYLIEQKITVPLLLTLLQWNLSKSISRYTAEPSHKLKTHIYMQTDF